MRTIRRPTFRGRMAAALGSVAILSSLFVAGVAAVPSNFMELDNNIVDDTTADPPYDWANIGALTAPVPGTWTRAGDGGIFDGGVFVNNTTVPTAPAQVTTNATIVDADFIVDPMSVHVTSCGTGDPTVFTGQGAEKNGGRFDTFTYATASVPNKDDLANIYALAHVDGATNEVFFGAERVVNNGDSHIDFEFLQSPLSRTGTCAGGFTGHRSMGDLLLVVDFTNGGALGGTQLFEWHCVAESGTQPIDGTVCDPPANGKSVPHYQSIGNTAVVFGVNGGGPIGCGGWVCLNPDGSSTATVATNEFMEGGIDLAQLGFTGCFSTLLPHTRSSQQFTATLKDFAIVNFVTCGTPEIVTTPNPAGPVAIGTTLNDTAVLSGGVNPTGSIIFKLFPPSSPTCAAGTEVYTDSVTVNGNGSYSTDDGGFVTNVAGTWNWTAFFDSADPARNPDAESGCGLEAVSVLAPTTILTKTAAVTTTVVYTYTEENDGSVPLTAPSVVDPDCTAAGGTVAYASGDTDTNGVLDPGETWTFNCTATYTGAGSFVNTATGHGTDPLGLDVTFCADPNNPPATVRCDQDEQDSVTVTVTISDETPAIP